jgi:hypothetical protein
MTWAGILPIAAIALVCGTAVGEQQPVTIVSPCECRDNHVKGRLSAKNDPALPPADASAIQAATPSEVYSWPGADARLKWQSERTGIENKWFALTGRVVDVRIEMDGDLHIALQDATGTRPGIVVAEIPAKPQWCEMRQTVFGWTRTRFPFQNNFNAKAGPRRRADSDDDRKSILRHRPCTQRPLQPAQAHAGLCCVGDSSGNENRSSIMNADSDQPQRRVKSVDFRAKIPVISVAAYAGGN